MPGSPTVSGRYSCSTFYHYHTGQFLCACLLDHLIRLEEERWGDGETERLGGREINDEIKFRGPLDREAARLGPAPG